MFDLAVLFGSVCRRAALVAAVLLLTANCYAGKNEAERLRIVAQNTARAEGLQRQIDRRFPPGAAEGDVLAFIRAEHPGTMGPNFGGGTNSSSYMIPVGREPSSVWYCGSFTAYLRLFFENKQLVRSEITRWSADCL
jgi:hypothetical protein